MLPLLLVTSVIIVFFSVKMGPLFLTVQQKLDRLNTVLQENIAGVRVVKAFVRADFEGQRFEEANEDYHRTQHPGDAVHVHHGPGADRLVNIGMVMVIWAGGLQSIQRRLTTGQIVAFVNYLQTTIGPLMIMVMLANVWAAGLHRPGGSTRCWIPSPRSRMLPEAAALPSCSRPQVVFENVGFPLQRRDR